MDLDEIYENLDTEKKAAVRQKAIEELKETNPSFENPKLYYMKEFLIRMKVRDIVYFSNIGGAGNG
jgi:hypothetical protein